MDKSRSREMGGVGLGLALVREIAVLHGGSAVSYTHLDVYKRQVVMTAGVLFTTLS